MVMWPVPRWDFYCILLDGIYLCLVFILLGFVVYGMFGLHVVGRVLR